MSPAGVHHASVPGEALVRENGDLEKSLTNYLNNQTTYLRQAKPYLCNFP